MRVCVCDCPTLGRGSAVVNSHFATKAKEYLKPSVVGTEASSVDRRGSVME